MPDPFKSASAFTRKLASITRSEDAAIRRAIDRANAKRREAFEALDDATKRVVRSSWDAVPLWLEEQTTPTRSGDIASTDGPVDSGTTAEAGGDISTGTGGE